MPHARQACDVKASCKPKLVAHSLTGMQEQEDWQHRSSVMSVMQDFVTEQLKQIPGVTLVEPEGAFYVLPVMTSFFGPSARADGFGSIPDADTLSRWQCCMQQHLQAMLQPHL